jgi:amino acid permease
VTLKIKNLQFNSGIILSAIFLIFTGTVGSGIFVLPYLFYHSNFVFASIFLLVLALVSLMLNLFYVQIVNSTPTSHQLAGYARIYLGPRFSSLASLNLIILSFGAIVAYSILFRNFMVVLLPSITAGNIIVIYFIVLLAGYFNSGRSRYSFITPVLLLLVLALIFVVSLASQNPSFLVADQYPNFAFFGATIFSLSGFTIIPEVRQLLSINHQQKYLSLVTIVGTTIVAIIYFIFTYCIIILSQNNLSINTVSGLQVLHPQLAKIISLFGLIIVYRASVNFLNILHQLFSKDLLFSPTISKILPLMFPIVSVFMLAISLLTVISLTGHITIFISALIICLIRFKLPLNFWTQFSAILVMLTLTFGLFSAL